MRATASVRAAIVALAGILALAGCSTADASPVGASDPALAGQWELQSASDATGSLDLSLVHITLTIAKGQSPSGRSACGYYSASIVNSLGSLWVHSLQAPQTVCPSPAQSKLEKRYFDALDAARRVTIVGGQMDLIAPGATLHFVKALNYPLTQFKAHIWVLNTVLAGIYTDFHAISAPGAATLRLLDDTHLAGNTGCRSFSGDYTQNAGEIVVTKLTLGPQTCPYGGATLDNQILAVIGSAFTFQVGTVYLSLTNSRVGLSLVYRTLNG